MATPKQTGWHMSAVLLKNNEDGTWTVSRTLRNLPAASRAVEALAGVVEVAYEPVPQQVMAEVFDDEVPLRAGEAA